jgi:hypothetical protein
MALALGVIAEPTAAIAGDNHGVAYLGVMVEKVSPEATAAFHLPSGTGTAITNVDQDGPACRAGLKSGDIVTAFNGKPVTDPEQFAGLIHDSAPGSTATMTVVRNGRSQDMKVTLGDWKQMATVRPLPPMAFRPMNPVGTMPATPAAPAAPPEFDVPGYPSISARHGIVVEPMGPQLCEYFGVPANKGVLVRSVDKGSPGAAAGLKAGDVIVRVNNETIHDMADWKRALRGHGKLTLAIMRDKKETTLQMTLPGNTSELNREDMNVFDLDTDALAAQMQELGPEVERNARQMATMAWLNQEQIDEIHRQAESAAKAITPEIKKQTEELRKQAEQMRKDAERAGRTMTPEMKKQAEEMRKRAEQINKDIAKMTPEIAKNAREMAETMKPTAKELSDMARDMAQQWKEMQPEFQKQMEELKKELQQKQHEWQEIFKESSPKQM